MESPPSISFAVTLLVVVAVLTATPLLQHLTELLDRLRRWSRWSPVTALGQLSLATATDAAWPVVVDMPPRQQRRPRRTRQPRGSTPVAVPVERTRPVTAVTPVDNGAVFEAPPQLPPGPVSPPRGEAVVGDVVNTSEQPVLELDPTDQLNVVVNVSYARSENGHRAVRVLDRRGQVLLQLTAAQAHQLALDLTQSSDVVGTIRVQAGFDS